MENTKSTMCYRCGFFGIVTSAVLLIVCGVVLMLVAPLPDKVHGLTQSDDIFNMIHGDISRPLLTGCGILAIVAGSLLLLQCFVRFWVMYPNACWPSMGERANVEMMWMLFGKDSSIYEPYSRSPSPKRLKQKPQHFMMKPPKPEDEEKVKKVITEDHVRENLKRKTRPVNLLASAELEDDEEPEKKEQMEENEVEPETSCDESDLSLKHGMPIVAPYPAAMYKVPDDDNDAKIEDFSPTNQLEEELPESERKSVQVVVGPPIIENVEEQNVDETDGIEKVTEVKHTMTTFTEPVQDIPATLSSSTDEEADLQEVCDNMAGIKGMVPLELRTKQTSSSSSWVEQRVAGPPRRTPMLGPELIQRQYKRPTSCRGRTPNRDKQVDRCKIEVKPREINSPLCKECLYKVGHGAGLGGELLSYKSPLRMSSASQTSSSCTPMCGPYCRGSKCGCSAAANKYCLV